MISLIWRVENVFQLYRHVVSKRMDSHADARKLQFNSAKSGTVPAVVAVPAIPPCSQGRTTIILCFSQCNIGVNISVGYFSYFCHSLLYTYICLLLINHILIDFIYIFPYRKVCNYFQIWGSNCTLFSVIAHLFNQSEARTFQI